MITQETLYLIITGAACLLVGILVASLFANRGSRKRVESDESQEIKKEGYAAIARLWYSPATKKIITEMEEAFYRDYADLSPEMQKKALRLAELFAVWVKPIKEEEETPAAFSAGTYFEESAGGFSYDTSADFSSQEQVPTHPGTTRPLPFVDMDEDLSSVRPTVPVNRSFASQESIEPPEVKPLPAIPQEPVSFRAKTVAGQISDIIYKMLESSPLREKGVKLIERADHGVDVWFGMEKFDGVDAVPYPEVRQLIKEAAIRWEREMRDKDND